MEIESNILLLQQRIERRTIRYRKMISHMAQLNAYPINNEHMTDVIHKNITKLWNDLENAKNELDFVIQSTGRNLYNNNLADSPDNKTIIWLNDANDELLKFLGTNPNYLHKLNSRLFEEVIAKIFYDLGCAVELTPATHDGGKDIILTFEGPTGKNIAYVECKKYSPENPVGIEIVRGVHSVHLENNVNKSLIVTTSHFTPEACRFERNHKLLISLHNYNDVVNWLKKYTK